MTKIIKSFKDLSKLNRRDLFKKRTTDKGYDLILKSMDKRKAVSIARQLSDGFDIDLRQLPTQSQYRRAQKVIKQYYENVANKNAKLIRPNKANRKLYAQVADLPTNFKVYPVYVSNKDNTLKIIKKNGKRKLKEVGQFVSYENFYFNNKEKLALNPIGETEKLIKKIDKIKDIKQVNIIVGSYLTNANYEISILPNEIERFALQYTNFQEFTRGLQVATFKNQKRKKKKNAKKIKKSRIK